MAYRHQDLRALTDLYPDRARAKIAKALESADTAIDAAILLGISKASLYLYLRKLGMDNPGHQRQKRGKR